MIVTPKSKQNGNVGARCIVPKVNRNNTKTERAQFIVPLQHNYNQSYFQRNTQYAIRDIIY